jgi:putative transposase
MNELRFFNPYGEIRHTENRLPHWQQENAVYFITFRLADAVPSHLRNQWESERASWLRLHPEPWSIEIELEYHKRSPERSNADNKERRFLNRRFT